MINLECYKSTENFRTISNDIVISIKIIRGKGHNKIKKKKHNKKNKEIN